MLHSESLRPCAFLPCIHVLWAFRDYDDISSSDSLGQVAKASQRHQVVVEDRPFVVYKNYGNRRFERSMLICIVQDYKICRRQVLVLAAASLLRGLKLVRVAKEIATLRTCPRLL